MNRVVLVLSFSKNTFGTFPAQSKKSLRNAVAWIEKKTLQIKHVSTLARFHNKEYGNKDDTINVTDAFNKGLLDPQALLSPLLATQIDKLTDKGVLTSWNKVTLEAVLASTSEETIPGAIPLNHMLRTAVWQANIDMLQWLAELKKPSQVLNWDATFLLSCNFSVARWAITRHPHLLVLDDPYKFLRTNLNAHSTRITREWFNKNNNSNTVCELSFRDMKLFQDHARSMIHQYFKDMPWRECWRVFLDNPLEPILKVTFDQNDGNAHINGRIIAGLLYNAPLDVQKCLAALKNSCHPNEHMDFSYDIGPKAIRHAFFGAPAPQGVVPVALVAWLSMMHGTPVEDVGNAWVQWHTNGPAKPAEMNVPLPCNVFEI